MYARTSLSIVFVASDRPMETDTDTAPLREMASAAAPTLAVMDEVSLALKATLPAVTPAPLPLPAPFWYACGSTRTPFWASDLPEPAAANPTSELPAMAADSASTRAWIFWFEVAVTV